MLYFLLLIYSLHACLICVVNVKLVPKLHLNFKKVKNYRVRVKLSMLFLFLPLKKYPASANRRL